MTRQTAVPCSLLKAGILSFFLNDTAPTEIYTLSLHDALPICWMRGCLKACMTASRTRRWEPGGKRSQTTKFGMRLPIFERWPPKEPGAWAADSDEIDALSDHVGAVDPDDWDCRMVYRAGLDDAGHRWPDGHPVGTGRGCSFDWNRDDRGCESGAHGEIAAPVQTGGYVDSPGHGPP